MNINKQELLITVCVNVLFISLFIACFFFTYAVYIEKKVVKNQMTFLSDNMYDDVKILGKNVNNYFKNTIDNSTEPDMVKEDAEVLHINNKVIVKAVQANAAFIILITIIVAVLYYNSDKSFKVRNIIIYNLIILFFVGMTEFSFLTYFGAKYISIDPNQIKLNILKNIHSIAFDQI